MTGFSYNLYFFVQVLVCNFHSFLLALKVDLDLGNYERFLDIKLTCDNNITTGKIYQANKLSMPSFFFAYSFLLVFYFECL